MQVLLSPRNNCRNVVTQPLIVITAIAKLEPILLQMAEHVASNQQNIMS